MLNILLFFKRETEGRLQELETMLATKQNRIEILEAEKTTAEANEVRLKELEVQLQEKENQRIEAKKEIEKHMDALKKVNLFLYRYPTFDIAYDER